MWGWHSRSRDDILDVTSTLEVLGKPIHSDDKNQKTTYVTLEGLEQGRRRMWRRFLQEPLKHLTSLPVQRMHFWRN